MSLSKQPIIIEAKATRTPWSLSLLKERFGERLVSIAQPEDPRFSRLVDDRGNVNLAKFLRKISRKHPPIELPYLRNVWLRESFPELVEDVVLPTWLEGNLLEQESFAEVVPQLWRPWIEFFISPIGVRFPQVHCDAYLTHAWLGQVLGTKRVYLWPPRKDIDLVESSQLQIEIDERTDLECLFEHAAPTVLELTAGQMAFIPSGWWHTTETLELSMTLSGNFVSADNEGAFYQAMLRSKAPEHEALRRHIRKIQL